MSNIIRQLKNENSQKQKMFRWDFFKRFFVVALFEIFLVQFNQNSRNSSFMTILKLRRCGGSQISNIILQRTFTKMIDFSFRISSTKLNLKFYEIGY